MKIRKFISDIVNFDIFLGIISGPIISTLVLLLPFGILVGLFEVLDPAFVAYEYLPEEILFFPWLIILIIISAINTRVAYLMRKLDISSRVYFLNTDKFFMRPEDRLEEDEYPGRLICNEFYRFVKKSVSDISCTIPEHRDYGWSFQFDKDINSIIEISFALVGFSDKNPHLEEYEISIDYLPPLNPFYRISFLPNPVYQEEVCLYLRNFTSYYEVNLKTEQSLDDN